MSLAADEDISKIPDQNNFALSGKQIKAILEILKVIGEKDRNRLFLLWRMDTNRLYKEVKDQPK